MKWSVQEVCDSTLVTMTTTTSRSLSNIYLTSLGIIFTIACISYYVQYPALSSKSGIEPCDRVFRRAYPKLYEKAIDAGYFDVDSFVEVMNLVGIVISTVIASGVVQHGLLFIAASSIYRLLYTLGGSFYTFQWDILLLETGYLTALCFAPWLSIRIQLNKQNGSESDAIGVWPLRFLLFKLMLMSGVVKIQANCPTWHNLTALEFHFATQCLPGPLAWHAHQLHPFLLRIGVAATFVIEIPAAYLLVCPIAAVRDVGAWLQILLQVLIIATGNYNFFNLLTIALCLPCMMAECNNQSPGSRRKLQATAVIFLSYWCFQMFNLYQDHLTIDVKRKVLGLKLAFSKQDCDIVIERTVPATVVLVLAVITYNALRLVIKGCSPQRRWVILTKALVCSFCVVATSGPLYSLTPYMKQPPSFQRILQGIPHENVIISSGYGLFRRMTGVGMVSTSSYTYGWAGVPPSAVARPEIIIEAVFEDTKMIEESEVWHELKFRWKPGNISLWPSQVAPHQPRFDWRMWFAALGSYQHNPWLISFLDKILAGCPVVLDLLDEPTLMSGEKRALKVRASLYEYDFTRMDTEWSRGIPNAKLLDNQTFWSFPEQVWTRKFIQQYLPPIEQNNPSVQQYLRQTGYLSNVCVDPNDRCKDIAVGAKLPCELAFIARRWNRPSILSFTVLVMIKLLSPLLSTSRKVKAD